MKKIINSFEAVIFDADGVIFDSEKLWDIGDSMFMQKRGISKIKDDVKVQLAGTSLIDGTTLLLKSHGLEEDVQLASLERMKIMETMYKTRINYMDGFLAFLHWIKSINLKAAVATSMNKNLFPFVDQRTGFINEFDQHVYSVSDVKHAKPAPDIYLYAANKINTDPAKCFVIEDAPNGIKAAKSAGMFCIGLASTFKPLYLKEANIVCQTFDDIKDYMLTP